MINGVCVPVGNPDKSQVVHFEAELATRNGAQCPDGIQPGNFTSDSQMLESLRIAKRACVYWLLTRAGLWDGFLLPLFGARLHWSRFVAALISLAACLIFSVGAFIWRFIPIYPPAFLLPGWKPFILFYLFLIILVMLSPPQRVLASLRSLLVLWRGQEELQQLLHNGCFRVNIQEHLTTSARFGGPSAGLAIFCVLVEAVKNASTKQFTLPWQKQLVDNMSDWVASVAFDNGDPENTARFTQLGNAPTFFSKINAIWNKRDELRLAIFCVEDQASVEHEWGRISGENLDPKPVSQGCRTTKSTKAANLTFLFCRDLKAFLRYLHPWQWRWLVFRLAMAFSIILLPIAISMEPTTPPAFEIECTPQPCRFLRSDIYRVSMESGTRISIHVQLLSRGFPGLLTLAVASNYDATLSTTRDSRLGKEFSHAVTQASSLFYFTMPKAPPSGEIVVVINMLNAAHKWEQKIIFFAPQ